MISARRLFVLLYTASGASALVYEVAWTRMLTLQLGHTVAAASTVLAAFMGGLALGAWVAPRLSLRSLRAYASLEIIVAAIALVLPSALALTTAPLAWAYADGTAPAQFALTRVAISLLLLGAPAAAMGATFPIAAECMGDASTLYAANTAGAALGAVAAGFWLVPALGLRGTTWVGVGLNALAAAGALWLARGHENAEKPTAESAKNAENTFQKKKKKDPLRSQRSLRLNVSAPAPGLASAASALSGFTALVYEVAWTRLLALVVGPTTYAFATMASAFIGGLAIGSAIGARIARRVMNPAVWLAATLCVSAVASSAAAWYAATRMPLVVAAQVADPAAAFGSLIATQAFTVGLLLLPMTLALGAAFPLALAVAGGTARSTGADAAKVYTANTIGAIGGALGAGFLFIPMLGLRATFQWTGVAAAIGGAATLALLLVVQPFRAARAAGRPARLRAEGASARPPKLGDEDEERRWKGLRYERLLWPAIAVAASVAAIVLLPSWDRELLASGAYKYAPYIAGGDFETALRAGTIEYYKEGAAGTVSVRRLTGTVSMAIDGKVDASNGGDMLTQRLLGLLPVLLHGRAEDLCVIGLGSGVTVGSAMAAGTVRRADVVEISPEVVEASHYFDRENGAALSNPAVRLIVGDGRSHLRLTPHRYDVIVSEPSNPWMAGVAALFTREFFDAARAALKPGGLLCQWAHTYDISADDLQSIVRTFASVFPQGTMWLVGESDLLLVGTSGADIAGRIAALTAPPNAAVSAALSGLGIAGPHAAFDLLSLYAGGPRELERYGGQALIQTDDRTALEYSAPRGIYGRTTNENAVAIGRLNVDPPPAVRAALAAATDAAWTSRGTMELKAEAFTLAYEAFRQALALNSRNQEALAGLSDAAAGAHKQAETLTFLKGVADREPQNAAVRSELARLLAASGDLKSAAAMAFDAVRLAPDDPHPAEQLASVIADAGDAERLGPLADALVERFPGRPDPKYYRANALFLAGKTEDALNAARSVVAAYPSHARAQNLLGAACATLGRRDCALAAFEASLRANPRDASTYVNLGLLHLQSGSPANAARLFVEALAIDPESNGARTGLAQARAQLSNPR